MIDIHSLINRDKTEISISSEYWTHLKKTYTQDEIKEAISSAIDTFDLPMPLSHISEADAETAFQKLIDFDVNSLINEGDVFSRYEYKYDFSPFYIGQSNVGNESSNYFHQLSRFYCDSINAPSPYRSWTIPKFRNGILNALFTLKFDEVNSSKLRTAISLRKYLAAQFKPSVAKLIYEKFDAKNVLDFSSGWGDRLAGFYATENTVKYTGIDPNLRLHTGYYDQGLMYSKFMSKSHEIHYGCAEDVLPTLNETYDMVFTSPPYFNIERYTQEENQSWKKYRKLDAWINDFLFPVLKESWNRLEDGGFMIVNISDVYSNHQVNNICDPMNDYISSMPFANYMGSLGMRMTKRPNSKSQQDGTFVEPMWVFSKGKTSSLEEILSKK